jgi:hypothetical protein
MDDASEAIKKAVGGPLKSGLNVHTFHFAIFSAFSPSKALRAFVDRQYLFRPQRRMRGLPDGEHA